MVRALPHTLSHPTMSSNSTDPSSSGSYVSLMGQALAPTTHSKYAKALARFEAFCDDQGFEVHRNRDVDRILTLYVQHLHDSGGSMDLAKNTIYAVQHRAPWLAHSLGAAKLALRGWHRTHPSNSHPPLTWELTCLMAVWMAIRGQHHAALAMLVGFDCYLRIGELLSLKVQDVAVSNDPRLGSAYRGVLLRLAHTKTGRYQAVTVEDSAVADMLTSHVQARGPSRTQSDLVFQVSRDSFYKLFHGACRAFGLDGLNYSPHSLRHGGATRHFLQKRHISDIQFRGRWSNSKSVRTYIQSGRALLLLTRVPNYVFQVAADCAQLFEPLLTYLKVRHTSTSNASAATLRAGRRTSSDRKVQDAQAS